MLPVLAAPLVALLIVGQGAAKPRLPVHDTRYGRASFRFEGRTDRPEPNAERRAQAESALARAGIDARWIEVVDVLGSALVRNPYLPCKEADPEANERALKAWVEQIHARGMAVLSWVPLTINAAANEAHPAWRQVFTEPYPIAGEERIFCCVASGYGDALIQYCIWAIKRFGLDGIWFDGSVWTPIWQRPYPLSCACAAYRDRFRADTGLELPARRDWSDPTFRKWVRWRFRFFGDFIGRLAGEIRAACPGAAVVINHYNRPGIPWRSAVPIDRYAADIISGSEATGTELVDLTMRLCRAYGREQSEVWRPFDLQGSPEQSAEALLDHALACAVAGGRASFGGDPFAPGVAPTAALIAPVIRSIAPLTGGAQERPVAIHVSQQTSTFHFARGEPGFAASDPFWASLGNWTEGLGGAHLPAAYLFDADIRAPKLRDCAALLMPLSIALSPGQASAVAQYVRQGGVLVVGRGAGSRDGEGEPADRNVLGDLLGFAWDGRPSPDRNDPETLTLLPVSGGRAVRQGGLRLPLRLRGRGWRPLLTVKGRPAAAERSFDNGRVLVIDTDPARPMGALLAASGATRLRPTRAVAAAGNWSLEFVDDPAAAMPFYPDLEHRIQLVAAPRCKGVRLECALRLGRDAQVAVELRSSAGPIAGPAVLLNAGGRVTADGRDVGPAPIGAWLRLRIDAEFAASGRPARYSATLTAPDGPRTVVESAPQAADWRALDWFVIYGAGTKPAVFHLDDLRVSRVLSDGSIETAVDQTFEDGPNAFRGSTELIAWVAQWLRRAAPPAVEVSAPASVRVGVYRTQAGLRVHLHRRDGRRADWQRPTGPPVALKVRYPVVSARLAFTGRQLPVKRGRRGATVKVGPIGLYQVVDLTLRKGRRP